MKKYLFFSYAFLICAAATPSDLRKTPTHILKDMVVEASGHCTDILLDLQKEPTEKEKIEACAPLDLMSKELERRNWCWGPTYTYHFKKHWIKCTKPFSEPFNNV